MNRRRRGGERGDAPRPPVAEGAVLEVPVEAWGRDGEGVARLGAYRLFVRGGLPGETVRVRVGKVGATHARAEVLQVLRPSPDRVAPPCGLAGICGGCPLQHLSYPAQLAMKRRRVLDALAAVPALAGVPVREVLGMTAPWAYRNKVQYPFGRHEGQVVAGIFEAGTHRIVDVDACAIQHPTGDRVMRAMRGLVEAYGVSLYDEITHTGVLRTVLVRTGIRSGEALAVLVTNGPDLPHAAEIARSLMAQVPGLGGVVQNRNDARTNVILGPGNRILAGKGTLTDRLGPFTFELSPHSFYQVNPPQAEVLYEVALEYAALSGTESVLDVYCGIGTISLFLARRAGAVVGIEAVAPAVEDARRNALRNGVSNVQFVCADAAGEMTRRAARGEQPDVVVVDPPRMGCDPPVLEAIAACAPERVVYVSCNPVTLARDLGLLAALGYRTCEVQPVDMFPHTTHVECCAKLVREGTASAGSAGIGRGDE